MTHWGGFEAQSDGTRITRIRPLAEDPDPVPLIENIVTAQHHQLRIDRPHVRESWVRQGPGARGRGTDRYIPVSWERAVELLSQELSRVYDGHGPTAVFGGSYGWASAGRFHHAQSQVHRFLNCLGGYVASINNYSYGASQVLLPHLVGSADDVMAGASTWDSISQHTDLLVAFGGLPLKNMSVSPGGIRRHSLRHHLRTARANGTRFVHVSPLRDDMPDEADSHWVSARPGTDAALMLGLAHVLVEKGLVNHEFLERYGVGYDKFEKLLLGAGDGVPKTPKWAAAVTGLDANEIVELACEMARGRTMITVSWSLQRTRHGEQPVWLAIVLASMLGQIGLPGGGFGHGYGSIGFIGSPRPPIAVPSLPQGINPVQDFIPVARIADMLLNPGGTFDYDGREIIYPSIKLVYWAGGNPFHHHQDLARLRSAFDTLDTLIVNESYWTATALHADIVLPACLTIERNDFAQGKNDPAITAMPQLTVPVGEAVSDFEIFSRISARLGTQDAFTEGRDEMGWLRHLYGQLVERLETVRGGGRVPTFEQFWERGTLELPPGDPQQTLFADFYADPAAHPLKTPSGRIEIHSETIASFGYDDFPGTPTWIAPEEWLGAPMAETYPLHLVANQPRTRLHSQLALGAHSDSIRIAGREPVRMNPKDAAARRLVEGDVVLLSSPRGRCLAGLVISDDVREGVVQLATGAWFSPRPDDAHLCQRGNPNVLTADVPSSRLTQGCAGQHSLVQISRATAEEREIIQVGPRVALG
jgi:biotin/methionine sulfoxide reductase